MKRFMDLYWETVDKCQDTVAISCENESLTYGELDEASAKIYSYLKSKQIGRETFVQIVLRRGVRIPAAVMGVIKAGAAFMVLEDTYPADRIRFIYEDCGCRLLLDDALYLEIMKNAAVLSGNEEADPHDACYAVYTSGSTGNPKGVLHEYGNIEQACKSFETWYDADIQNCAIFAPFYFVAGIIDIFHYITRGRTTYIVPHDMTRDFVAVKRFITDNNIQEIFLPPSYLRIYEDPSPALKVLYTGSEPANGLSYHDKPTLINFYALSESGFVVLQSNLRKPYDVAPVGTALLDEINVCLLDEDGNVVTGEGQGELCFVNEYVRGYINLPELTKRAFRCGLFHTGDLVRRDKDGVSYVTGRFDDMIKINGNRVEPVEIESHVKRLTGLEQVIARGFAEPDRSYICLYYLTDEARRKGLINNGELSIDREKLERLIPDYMMPTYYIGLDSFPRTATGKIYRKGLKAPEIRDYKSEYVAPDTDIERFLCRKMAETLKLEKVSALDDFFSLGGDSMRAITFISLCAEAGVNISHRDLYDHRTPRALAAICGDLPNALDSKLKSRSRTDNSGALEVPNCSGKAFLIQAKEGKSGIFRYHLSQEIKEDVLLAAYEKVVTDNPFFKLTFEERKGNVYYRESENQAMVRPFRDLDLNDHTGKPLIEVYFENNDIVISYYHLLTDGEGVLIFATTLLHEYICRINGKKNDLPPASFDYTYDVLAQRIESPGEYRMHKLPKVYKLPESGSGSAKVKTFKLRLPRKKWQGMADSFIDSTAPGDIRGLGGIGGTDAFVAGYLMMRSIAQVHPDADRPLMCRFPINMRYALGREGTLRNCALPQAFYNITAKELLECSMTGAYERILQQTSAYNVEKEVNRLFDYMNRPELNFADDPVYQYIRQANVLSTSLGNIAHSSDAEYVKDFSISFTPTCAMSIQSCICGQEQILIVNQKFESDVYVKRLARELKESCVCDIITSIEES